MDVTKEIESLVKKADNTTDATDALKFSQAAANAANAMAVIRTLPPAQSSEGTE